ncbi:MAG TPA: type II toxin-antitoxin system VapC family toxin [Geminicoccaceae bacterium]
MSILVTDTSALVAILREEPEADVFAKLLEDSDPAISAGSVIEAIRAMTAKRGPDAGERVWRFLKTFRVRIVSVTAAQVHLAEEGMARFGKGRGAPPAVLNFGDLFAYALARHLDAPLLFKGNDFGQTDVKVALPTP